MKKRAMKKYIPKDTVYCYHMAGVLKDKKGNTRGIKTNTCRWRKFLGMRTVEGEYNGEHYKEKIPVYQCKYLGIIDNDMDTLLWDSCKECGEHYPKD